jgi:AcrR family transcriptional regulator
MMAAGSEGQEAEVVAIGGRAPAAATTNGRVPGQRGRQTRQRLLDATVELLTTTSWRSVKVTDIARRARTSPATFYQYFGNVEEAVRVLAEGVVDQAARLSELAGGDWSDPNSWNKALTFT